MRKFLQMLSATAVIGLALSTAAVSADSVTCGNISDTGAGSTNTVKCVDKNGDTVSCVNNVIVDSSNSQSSSSGTASTSGNTNSGGATSGSASNNNSTTVQVGASCAPAAKTSSSSGGSTFTVASAAAVTSPAKTSTPAAATSVASLPGTGSNTAIYVALATVAGFVVLLFASRLGLVTVKRHLK